MEKGKTMNKEMHKVVIVEDNVPLSDAFKEIINDSEDFKVVDAYTSCEDAIKYLKQDQPNIILMDIELPGMSGVEGTKTIKSLSPDVIIIVVTVYENSEVVFDALCAGASGYLTKNISSSRLIEAMKEAILGGAPMSIRIARMVVQSFRKATNSNLSDREIEVLKLLASGKSYQSIGDELFISRNTIKFHIKNIYEKLQVQNKEQAIKKANQDKII